ncbi:MAG: hypothetical protein RBT75_05205 [Anaerolineae bacterium]|jgi:hypothetical protein|nr:hypothetical protein [Anaerolineae bacterium]
MSNLEDTHQQLAAHWKVLQQRWQVSRAQWDDAVARGFEREHWHEYEQIVPATLKEMCQLAEVITQARRQVR